MSHAWIDGRPVALHAATAEAARLLAASRVPVVAGLGTDIAGARAAIALAERIGAAVDHMSSDAILRDVEVMRATGMMVTTPNEARLRADVLLLIGAGLVEAWPELPARLLVRPPMAHIDEKVPRRIIWLCAGGGPTKPSGHDEVQMVGRNCKDLPALLAALRARVAGRPVGKTSLSAKALDALAADLRAARFGVAVWSAAALDLLTIEMLCGLVADLNTTTRFTGLALAAADNALGVLQVCGWMTGFPMRTGFGRGFPEHDTWRFDAERLVESGEADCAVWISAYRAAAPAWNRPVPMIALTGPNARFRQTPRVHIDVGRPGADHDAVEHCAATGTLVPAVATNPSRAVSVADALAHILSALPSMGGGAVLTRVKGGRVIDPANGQDGIADIWLRDGRIVDAPADSRPDETYDAAGKIVTAGAIDIHSHIAGSNVNTARLLLPELHRSAGARRAQAPLSNAEWGTFQTGCRYATMGFTTVVEPAVAPNYALHAHLELADIPIIDKATLSVLGNDDYLLSLMRSGTSASLVRDYVAWTLATSRALGIKVINAGGAAAFKCNVREFSFDDVVPFYGVSSRAIVKTLQRAVHELGVPHPLHVHCNNLGLAGNAETALETIAAAEGLPLHLAHLQFYGYGKEGERGFSSAAARLAEAVNGAKSVTVDVGQVMFGQTVTISSDVLRQFNARAQASPKKWVIFDGDANGGGIVPYNYRSTDFYNAVQWCVGLELFLLIDDPARVFFTTDHPNGAPFTTYPEIFALLMDRDLRAQWIATLPPAAVAMTTLASIKREYSLNEVVTMTRAAPARLLGLRDRGHLGVGAVADVAVYANEADRAKMFRAASLVFKDGELVVRDGEVTRYRWGRALTVAPGHDRAIERRMQDYYSDRYGLPADVMTVPATAIGRPEPFEAVPCAR